MPPLLGMQPSHVKAHVPSIAPKSVCLQKCKQKLSYAVTKIIQINMQSPVIIKKHTDDTVCKYMYSANDCGLSWSEETFARYRSQSVTIKTKLTLKLIILKWIVIWENSLFTHSFVVPNLLTSLSHVIQKLNFWRWSYLLYSQPLFHVMKWRLELSSFKMTKQAPLQYHKSGPSIIQYALIHHFHLQFLLFLTVKYTSMTWSLCTVKSGAQ